MNEAEHSWSSAELDRLNDHFRHESPRTLLAWAQRTFGTGLALGTGFGPSGIVLMHIAASLRPTPLVFYLETDLLFPETYALRDRLSKHLRLDFHAVHCGIDLDTQANDQGPDLWARDSDSCCALRKVMPLRRFLQSRSAWVTGVRRDQGGARANTPLLSWHPTYKVLKVNPLAHWTRDDVWGYIRLHELPYNDLHDQGYPSIGCWPCTQLAAANDSERAGRWAGQSKTECGIHT